MKTNKWVWQIAAVLLASLNLLQAQSQLSSRPVLAGGVESAAPADSIVQATAEAQGLELVSPTDLPPVGTFWIVTPSGTYPFPCPMSDANAPTYQIADGVYLVDQTGGQVLIPRRRGANLANVSVADALAAQADAIVNLINRVQDDLFTRELASSLGLSMDMDPPSGYSPMFSVIDTNGLWLDSPNVSNGWSYVNLHNGTNFVYAIWSSTNLATPFSNWEVETELFPTGDQTNVMPFAVQNIGRTPLFLRAEDWTGVDSDGDGIPNWWAWQYWGSINVTDTNLDYSGNGSTFAQDYSNNVAPTVFSFTGLAVANNYVSSMSAPVQLDVAGSPYYVATLVDDPNFSNAVWNTYSSSSLTVNLGLTEGWHDVWVGLRGHADDANSAVWQWRRLKLDFTPPTLVITSPTNPTVNVPVIQLTGFSPESLTSISYDLSNAAGLVTNQPVLIIDQHYDPGTFEFTTNIFQAFDIPLTNGLNTFTLHATDLAGNVMTTNFSFTLDYSGKTNPPAVRLNWPTDGMVVGGNSFICSGSVGDPTADVTAQMAGTDVFSGAVGRDGTFWLQNLPLAAGTNLVTLTVADVAGNVATTNITLIQGVSGLAVDPVAPNQTTVTGEIGSTNYAVWVNGVRAAVSPAANGDGFYTWEADNVPLPPNAGLVQVSAVFHDGSMPTENAGAVASNAGEYVASYDRGYRHEADDNEAVVVNDYAFDWADGKGGQMAEADYDSYTVWGPYFGTITKSWPGAAWPQSQPAGTEMDVVNGATNWPGAVSPLVPADFPEEHCDAGFRLAYSGYGVAGVENDRKVAQTKLTLATGGAPGSTKVNLWMVSANATAETFIKSELNDIPLADQAIGAVPFTNIYAGVFGQLDAQGNAYKVLPDNTNVDVTPYVPGNDHYIFNLTQRKIIPDLKLAVDMNRSGGIDFDTNGPDATSPTNPYCFWLNNNHDGIKMMDNQYPVQEDLGGDADASSTIITCTRDLEDYTRLGINIEGISQKALTNGFVKIRLESDGPQVHIYPAVADDSTLYLTDAGIAQQQISAPNNTAFTDNEIPKEYWIDHYPTAYLLFDGISGGSGTLKVSAFKNNQQIGDSSPPVYVKLQDIKNMYERWSCGQNGGIGYVDPASTATLLSPTLDPSTCESQPYILCVHGYNLDKDGQEYLGQTAFKRLWWQGYRGRFGLFEWPTTFPGESGSAAVTAFDMSEYIALKSAAALEDRLKLLHQQYGANVYLFAHSHGNMVVGEALRKAALDGLGTLVQSYIACQAAVPVHCYDSGQATPPDFFNTLRYPHGLPCIPTGPETPNIYPNWFASAASVVSGGSAGMGNFYNVNDYALSREIWETDEAFKPDDTAGITPPYGYHGSPDDNPPLADGFRKYDKTTGSPRTGYTDLSIPLYLGTPANLQDRYEIIAFAAEPRCRALGRTPGANGFNVQQPLGLGIWPYDPYDLHNYASHPWHSGEFNFDTVMQNGFWKALLTQFKLNNVQ